MKTLLATRAGFAGPAPEPYTTEGVLGEGLPSPNYESPAAKSSGDT
jgi:hypothetical protein